MKGSVRLTVHLTKPIDLVKVVGEMARRGFWVSKVVPTESGFEVFSPEPGLVGAKVEGDQVSYKLYSSPDGTALTLFGDDDKLVAKLAELVSLMASGGCGEDCIAFVEMNANFDVDPLCPFGRLEVEGLPPLQLAGLVAQGEREAVSFVPLNEASYLMVYTVRGSWEDVKRRAIALRSLVRRAWEVAKSWTCRQ